MKYNDLEAPFKMWIHLLHEWSLTRSPPCSLVGWLVVILLKEKSWLSGISMGSFEGEVGKLVNGFIGCHVWAGEDWLAGMFEVVKAELKLLVGYWRSE